MLPAQPDPGLLTLDRGALQEEGLGGRRVAGIPSQLPHGQKELARHGLFALPLGAWHGEQRLAQPLRAGGWVHAHCLSA